MIKPVVMQANLGTIAAAVQLNHTCLLALVGLLRANGGEFVVSMEEAFRDVPNPDQMTIRVIEDEVSGLQIIKLDMPPVTPGGVTL